MRTLLLLFVALGAAAMAAIGAQTWLSSERTAIAELAKIAPSEPEEKPAPRNHILVASVHVQPGQFITKAQIEWQPWPEQSLNKAYILKTDKDFDFKGSVTTQAIAAGQPLSRSLLVSPGERGFLAAVLTPGMRAVSVPVDATRGISGLVFPGDHIDLILSREIDGLGNQTRYLSQTVLADVRILAVDQTLDGVKYTESDAKKKTTKATKARSAKTVTLEVKPKQAEKVALGLKMGTLSLSLRSLAADDSEFISDYTVDNVFPTPSRPTEPMEKPILRKTRTVTVLRGAPAG